MVERTLRSESSSPLYVQIMERIRQDIFRGTYSAGSRIPAEHELEIRYSVSRVTVRRALQELTAAGLLERKQGKGTFVSQMKEEREKRPLLGFHDACRQTGKTPSVLSAHIRERKAKSEERIKLGLQEDASVIEIRRVLAADGVPVIFEQCCFSMAYAWLEGNETESSLYRILQEYGVQAEKSTYDLSLVTADEEAAEMLHIPIGMALIRADQVVYDQKGRPLHTAHRLICGDRYTLLI